MRVDLSDLAKLGGPSAIRTLDVLAEGHIRYAAAEGWVGQTLDHGETWTQTQWLAPDSTRPRPFGLRRPMGPIGLRRPSPHPLGLPKPHCVPSNPLGSIDTSAAVFLDAMAWWNSEEGLVFGDPWTAVSLLETRDAGQSWQRLSCDDVPQHTPGEAGFAASNGNICIQGDTAWVFTGGVASRCLRSSDRGHNWKAIGLPIRQENP